MAFELIIKSIVWIDLEEAMTWYENSQRGLALKFFINVEQATENILANTNAYQTIIAGVRRILIKKFPYKLFYTVSGNKIFIIGLAHAKRSNAYIRR